MDFTLLIPVIIVGAVVVWWFFIRKPDNSLVGQPVMPEDPLDPPYKSESSAEDAPVHGTPVEGTSPAPGSGRPLEGENLQQK